MLTQRSEGLRRLLLICQIWITAGLFWLGVWVMVKFYSPGGGLTWRRYSIYCVLLMLGLTWTIGATARALIRCKLISCGNSGKQEKFVMAS
jgi:hypothetical protein